MSTAVYLYNRWVKGMSEHLSETGNNGSDNMSISYPI